VTSNESAARLRLGLAGVTARFLLFRPEILLGRTYRKGGLHASAHKC